MDKIAVIWKEEVEQNGYLETSEHYRLFNYVNAAWMFIDHLKKDHRVVEFYLAQLMDPTFLRALDIGYAILSEADFKGIDLRSGAVEHQLGTVYVNDAYITVERTESDS